MGWAELAVLTKFHAKIMPHLVKVEEEGAHLDLSTVLHKGESEIKVDSNSEFMASWIGLAGTVPPIPPPPHGRMDHPTSKGESATGTYI